MEKIEPIDALRELCAAVRVKRDGSSKNWSSPRIDEALEAAESVLREAGGDEEPAGETLDEELARLRALSKDTSSEKEGDGE